MPALHIEDLSEKEKLKMEVEQLRKEVKLQRQQVSWLPQKIAFSEMNQSAFPDYYSITGFFLSVLFLFVCLFVFKYILR